MVTDVDRTDSSGSSDHTKTDDRMNVVGEPAKPVFSRKLTEGVNPEDTAALRQKLSHRFTVSKIPNPRNEDFSLEDFLNTVMAQAEDENIHSRQVGVTFQDLAVLGSSVGVKYNTTFADILQLPVTAFKAFQASRHRQKKHILKGFSGNMAPGTMCLTLGRPGSGCSSFLKVMANYRDSFDKVEGFVDYSGIAPDLMSKRYGGETVYLPEDDIHFPTLTVQQTLDFAASARSPSSHARLAGLSRQFFVETGREIMFTLFGLRHTANTKVGGDYIRGVSGGERKRVSIAEALMTRAKVLCQDNATRGLDSSTSLSYVRSLRTFADCFHTVVFACFYQAGEQLYREFDKVCLIMEGRQIYFGPADQAKAYFEDLGYEPHARQTTPDFLVALTDVNARSFKEGCEAKAPKTADELVNAYLNSKIYEQELEDIKAARSTDFTKLDEQFKESAKAEKAKHLSKKSPYNINYMQQTRLAIRRRFQLLLGDIITPAIQTAVAIFQALIIGSVFLNIPETTAGFFSMGGVIFFAILYNSLTGLSEITALYSQKPILIRHKRFAMARPSTDAIALTLVDFPVKVVTIICFDLVLYWMTGLAATPSQFFIFLLFTILSTLTMTTFFRMLAALSPKQAIATLFGGLAILVFVITVGYAIPRPSMLGWYRWFSIGGNNLAFVFEALLTNQFLNLNVPCAQYIPSGPGYENVGLEFQTCPAAGYDSTTGLVNGPAYLLETYGYSYTHTWRNLGFVLAYWIFFQALYILGTELQKDEAAAASVTLFKRGKAPKHLKDQIGGVAAPGDVEGKAAETKIDEKEKDAVVEQVLDKPTDVFTFRHLDYTVPIKKENRKLLDDVSGYVLPGKMTALMGESGAGKTTLLNVLAQRVSTGVVHGDMLVNGRPLTTAFQRQTGYAQQQDVHMSTATVREALQFSAFLRQPASVPKQEKIDYCENIIQLLEMESFAEALVGEPGSGLDVEQRKKLTIGVELAGKPKLLLFLDEPTSGLDSQSSWAIIQLLKKLAAAGQAILATIHQPSGELFTQFDRLLLLKKGGQVVYNGELGANCSTMLKYFESVSGNHCPEDANPAEFMLDEIGAGATAKATRDWAEAWRRSSHAQDVQNEIDELHAKYGKNNGIEQEPDAKKVYAAPFFSQLFLVTRRAFQFYWRTPNLIMAKLGLNVFAGLWIGFTFFNAGTSVAALQLRLFAVFMSLVVSNPLAQQLQPQYLLFRSLYEVREQPSRMYHWLVSCFAAVAVEIPWNIVGASLFYVCWQWTVGLADTTERQGYIYAMYLLFTLYYSTFAQALAAVAPNAQIASILFATLFSFVIIFCGVLQPTRLMPSFWKAWMPHLATFTYIVEGMLSSALGGGIPIVCSQNEFSTVSPPNGQTCGAYLQQFLAQGSGYVDNPDATSNCLYCQYASGDQYLATVGYSYSNRARDIGIVIAYIAFNFFLLFGASYLRLGRSSSKVSHKGKGDRKAVASSSGSENTQSGSPTEKGQQQPKAQSEKVAPQAREDEGVPARVEDAVASREEPII